MTYLLDINCVIALFDGRHVNHEDAHAWFVSVTRWAVSPIIENGVIRILSHPSYPTVITTPQEAADRLARFYDRKGFVFWTDDVSIVRDLGRPDRALLIGHNQVMDWYLALLARKNGGKLSTFDRALSRSMRGTSLAGTLFSIPLLH